MKILIATDGSRYSEAATDSITRQQWSDNTEFKVLSVADPFANRIYPPSVVDYECSIEHLCDQASEIVTSTAKKLRRALPRATVSALVLTGAAGDQIVGVAKTWNADCVVIGSHGRGAIILKDESIPHAFFIRTQHSE